MSLSRGGSRGLAPMDATGSGTLISYSTAPGKTAADGDGRNSPYTTALLQELADRPNRSLLELFNDVSFAVQQQTDGQQIPWIQHSPLPTVYLEKRKKPEEFLSKNTSHETERMAWNFVKRSTYITTIEDFLQEYLSGKYSYQAKKRIFDYWSNNNNTKYFTDIYNDKKAIETLFWKGYDSTCKCL